MVPPYEFLKNYRNLFFFLLAVRYFITVKVGKESVDQFKDNLNINIIAKSYATGFIQLDKSLAFLNKTKDERAKSNVSTFSKKSKCSLSPTTCLRFKHVIASNIFF